MNSSPPWSKKDLNLKRVGALRQMLDAYGIEAGKHWKKKDLVKALYKYSNKWVANQQSQASRNENAAQQGIEYIIISIVIRI